MSDDPSSRSPDPEPAGGDDRTPFERFEDVLRKVVSVPKSEIPKKRDRER
jgi:hypothetical protein